MTVSEYGRVVLMDGVGMDRSDGLFPAALPVDPVKRNHWRTVISMLERTRPTPCAGPVRGVHLQEAAVGSRSPIGTLTPLLFWGSQWACWSGDRATFAERPRNRSAGGEGPT